MSRNTARIPQGEIPPPGRNDFIIAPFLPYCFYSIFIKAYVTENLIRRCIDLSVVSLECSDFVGIELNFGWSDDDLHLS